MLIRGAAGPCSTFDIGELVDLGPLDAGSTKVTPVSPRTTMLLLQTYSLGRTQTPSATSFGIGRCCQQPERGAVALSRGKTCGRAPVCPSSGAAAHYAGREPEVT